MLTTDPRALVVKHARDGFGSSDRISAEWRALRFTAAPDLGAAIAEYDHFLECLHQLGATTHLLPAAADLSLDSIYVRDASVICARGAILCRMGKPQRAGEPAAQEAWFQHAGVPVLGTIRAPGTLEGGDVTWLGDRVVAVGRGYRTNAEGIRQFRALLGDAVDECLVVPLPHWHGPDDVFHLMSIISPIDRGLAVVYARLLPVPFREWLLDHDVTLVEVPDEEFDTMGANVLAVAPRRCMMVRGNPRTRARLERAGAEVLEYDGAEISLKGGGGPTCLTRPLGQLQ